jgi:hypothetical protein
MLRTSFLRASFGFLVAAAMSISLGLLKMFDISFEDGRFFFFVFLSFSVFTLISALFLQKEFSKGQIVEVGDPFII